MTTALILFAHGSRDAQWAEPMHAIARLIEARTDAPARVDLAFLEFMTPTLAAAIASAAAAGVKRIRVAPLFLGAGAHLRRDVAALVDAARGVHPNLTIEVCGPMGESGEVLAAIAGWAGGRGDAPFPEK